MNSQEQKKELVFVARAMINREINLIEGIRKICSLRTAVDTPDNPVFLPIRAIESETDHFPLEKVRAQYSSEYLERLDSELESYLKECKEDILGSCRNIIREFSDRR